MLRRGRRLRDARLFTTREGRIGVVLLVLVVGIALLGPVFAPYPPTKVNLAPAFSGPSGAHLLGTDELGRDVLSRVLNGGRQTLLVPTLATALAFLLGASLGVLAGYIGGRLDAIFTRLVDVLLAMPALLLVLILVTGAGSSATVIVLAVGLVFAPRVARVVRGATQSVTGSEFVEAARARGEPAWYVAFYELLPNISGVLLVEFAVRFVWAVLFIAGLNFLGIGVEPPEANWGLMIAENRQVLEIVPLATLAPLLCIAAIGIAANLIADGWARVLLRTTAVDLDD